MDNLEEESFYRCLQPSKNVGLDDVKGLENALQELRTHVELPLTRPELFQGTRSPERSLLLCGPPGTGKTMLIQAFSKEVNCTFLPISVSSLVSASPSTLQSLFRYAENHAPALVFFDEIDVLSYDSVNSRLENLKTELLSLCEQCPQGIVVIGATAYPWRMEPRFRRRFERRVWVEMPNTETRKEIAKELVKDGECVLSDTQLKTIADMTEGYTGADILSLIRDVLMTPLRDCVTSGFVKPSFDQENRPIYIPCSSSDLESMPFNSLLSRDGNARFRPSTFVRKRYRTTSKL